MFGSALTYVCLRLLGEGPYSGDGAMEKGRIWILDHGGATYITSWGKFWLTVGIYHYYLYIINVSIWSYALKGPLCFCLRYLVYMTGPVTTHYHQNYGCCHIRYQFTQVLLPHVL
jgi:hypothetical protein